MSWRHGAAMLAIAAIAASSPAFAFNACLTCPEESARAVEEAPSCHPVEVTVMACHDADAEGGNPIIAACGCDDHAAQIRLSETAFLPTRTMVELTNAAFASTVSSENRLSAVHAVTQTWAARSAPPSEPILLRTSILRV